MNWFSDSKNDSSECIGVDANKNFDYNWMKKGTSDDECSDFFGGHHASSEPEVKLLSNFIMDSTRNIEMFISLNGYGQKISFSLKGAAPDVREVAYAGIRSLRTTKLKDQRFSIEARKRRAGSVDQFSMHKANIRYSYNLEARDDDTYGFFVPATSIKENARELFEIIGGMVKSLME